MATVTDYYKKHLKNPSDNKIIYPKTIASNVYMESVISEGGYTESYVNEDVSIDTFIGDALYQGVMGQHAAYDETLPEGDSFINDHGYFAGTYFPKGSYILIPGTGLWYYCINAISRGSLITSYCARTYIGDELSSINSKISSLNSDLTAKTLAITPKTVTGLSYNYTSIVQYGKVVSVSLRIIGAAGLVAGWATIFDSLPAAKSAQYVNIVDDNGNAYTLYMGTSGDIQINFTSGFIGRNTYILINYIAA